MSKAPSSPEIERKFLVDPNALPFDLHTLNGAKIEQGYLAVNKNSSTEVRVRRRDGAATLTVKKGKGRVRDEGEINLTQSQWETLWPFTTGWRVEKIRYDIKIGNLTAELDIYAGKHEGLSVVEVEFSNDRNAAEFGPPDWFGDEVTEEPAYKNQQLAEN